MKYVHNDTLQIILKLYMLLLLYDVCRDPSFDIFKASYPYAKRRAVETLSVGDYGKISRNLISLKFESN